MFRSKCRWIEKGEKPTKYFFNFEKRNYNRKIINELRIQDGEEIREEKEILKVIQEFYEDLYRLCSTCDVINFSVLHIDGAQ